MALSAFFTTGCDSGNPINDALAALLERTNEDSFVIIEDPSTKKFVQFTRDDSGYLIYNFPTKSLHPIDQPVSEPLRYDEFVKEFPSESLVENMLLPEPEIQRLTQFLEHEKIAFWSMKKLPFR